MVRCRSPTGCPEIALAVPSCNIIASGGVSCADDVTQLRELSIECPNIEGVIIGKTLYEENHQFIFSYHLIIYKN